jgi:hypothetical protein
MKSFQPRSRFSQSLCTTRVSTQGVYESLDVVRMLWRSVRWANNFKGLERNSWFDLGYRNGSGISVTDHTQNKVKHIIQTQARDTPASTALYRNSLFTVEAGL